jgi:hypothetical protein
MAVHNVTHLFLNRDRLPLAGLAAAVADGVVADIALTEVSHVDEVHPTHAEGEDEQGYYDNYYAAKKLRIDKILTRKEILEYILKINNEFRVINFLMYFKLTDEEIDYFIARYDKSIKILKAILYYQKGMKDIYNTEGLDRSLLTGKKM